MGVKVLDPRIEEGKAKIQDNSRVVMEVERLAWARGSERREDPHFQRIQRGEH